MLYGNSTDPDQMPQNVAADGSVLYAYVPLKDAGLIWIKTRPLRQWTPTFVL